MARRPPITLIREYAEPGSDEDRQARLALGRLLLDVARRVAAERPPVPPTEESKR